MINFIRKIIFIIVIAVVSTFTAIGLLAHGGEDHSGASAAKSIPAEGGIALAKESQFALGVHTDIASERLLPNTLVTSGFIIPTPSGKAEIYPPVSGKIVASHTFTAGETVKKGQILFSVQQIISGTERLALEQDLTSARKEFDEASKDLARKESLQEIVAKKEIELAKIRETAAREHLNNIKNGLVGGTKVLSVYSPIGGTVSFSDFVNGEYTDVSKKTMEIVTISTVWVKAQIYENDIQRAQTAKTATIAAQTGALPILGKLVSKGEVIDPQSRTLSFFYEVDNSAGELKINGSATVLIDMNEPQSVISIPQSSILSQNGRSFVIVHRSPEKFEVSEIVLGLHKDGQYTELVKGISSGDRVVTNNHILFKQYLP